MLRTNIAQHDQVLPNSGFGESSWASKPEIPHILPYIYANLLLNLPSYLFLDFSHNQLLSTAVLSPFHHSGILYSVVLNCS